MQKTTRFNLTYLFIAAMGVFVIHDLWAVYQSVAPCTKRVAAAVAEGSWS
jgi:hypothetical protein